jgi:predicted DNA-binding transcriptional regulator AlpA
MQTQIKFYREKDLINRPATAKGPASIGVLNISKSTFWKLVNSGKFPPRIKLSERVVGWRVEDVEAYLANLGGVQ